MIALGIVLAVLLLIALIPVGVQAQYDEQGLLLRVMAGKVGLRLYPRREKQPDGKQLLRRQRRMEKRKKRPPKQKKLDRHTAKTPPKKSGLGEVGPLLELARAVLGDLRRKLVVRKLWLRVCFGGSDAARSAIAYGRAWAAIGAVMPVLESLFRIENRDVAAEFDPTKEQMAISARLDLRMRIGALVALGMKAGFRFLKILMKQKKAVLKDESSSV